MKALPAKKLIQILEDHGFHLVRQRGSHQIFRHTDGRIVPVPLHGKSKAIHIGTFKAIVKQSGIPPEAFDIRR